MVNSRQSDASTATRAPVTVSAGEEATDGRMGAVPEAPTRRRTSRRRLGRDLLANGGGMVIAAVWIFPVYWMASTFLKQGQNILSVVPKWIPTNPTLSNLIEGVTREYFWASVRNSLIVVTVAVVVMTSIAFLAAVAVGRFRFRGRRSFLFAVIAIQMVPLNAMVIPVYLLASSVNMTNRLIGLIVIYMAFTMPFTVWMLRGFVINVPEELEQAAMVDGCTRFGAFRHILFPLVAPGLVATSIFAIITAWNEYLLAYVMMTEPGKQTLAVWLAGFISRQGTAWGPLMAVCTLSAIPVVIFFAFAHKKIASGLTAGAIKG